MYHRKLHLAAFCLIACLLNACADIEPDADQQQTSDSAPATVQDCVRACGQELDAAFEKGNVDEVAERLVTQLDDFEDFVDGEQTEPFEKLHRAMEQLQTAARSESKESLKPRIDEIKKLASEFLDTES